MTDKVAVQRLYIRTPAGSVRVAKGEGIPTDALPDELARLDAAELLADAPATPEPSTDPVTSPRERKRTTGKPKD